MKKMAPYFNRDIKYAVGIGITNRCNLSCPHCYSQQIEKKDLSFDDIKWVAENLNIESINLGTGESGLHPDFQRVIEYFHEKRFKMSLTTNGYSVSLLSDEQLKWFNDIDFSLDFPTEKLHDQFRGNGVFRTVIKELERCSLQGIKVSIATVFMNENSQMMDKMVWLAKKYESDLRINIYKPVNSYDYCATFENFWSGIKLLFESSKIVSCSEPIVNAFLRHKHFDNPHMISHAGSVCGKGSIRINPDGKIVPCVYLNEGELSLNMLRERRDGKKFEECFYEIKGEDLHHNLLYIPSDCRSCNYVDICGGGCFGRRYYRDIRCPDEFCFILRKKDFDMDITFSDDDPNELVHSNYLCTIIVKAT